MCVDFTLILIFSGLLLGLHCADCSDSRRYRCVRGELRTTRAVEPLHLLSVGRALFVFRTVVGAVSR
jgi:hypothetical protein